MITRLLPLAIVVALGVFLYRGLSLDPSELPSPLVDKPAPAFTAHLLEGSVPAGADLAFDSASMLGEVWLLNVWASWCGPCVQEHPQIVEFARTSGVPVLGLNYKDSPADATAWLGRYGDPFARVVSDVDGAVGLDYGVYGVPETFVIDAAGRIRYKHVGPIDPAALRDTLLPLVETLVVESGQAAS